ncbi:MAG: hemerythrin family protein [Rhodocyclales bacterium]|nr:hemerythrin family protein [Rhodocyclales bacterium]
MPIVWRDAFSIGYRQIDDDHRHLLDLINIVEGVLTGEYALGRLFDAIDDLATYTRQHFALEERLMMAAMYPGIDRHKAAHRELIEQLQKAAKPIRELKAAEPLSTLTIPEEARDALVGLLRHWLVDHIIKEDMQLKSVL